MGIRRAIAKYADSLEGQAAERAGVAAVILTSVAHRLRQILDNHPRPHTHTEWGYRANGKIHPLETMDNLGNYDQLRLYKREVTEWKEVK